VEGCHAGAANRAIQERGNRGFPKLPTGAAPEGQPGELLGGCACMQEAGQGVQRSGSDGRRQGAGGGGERSPTQRRSRCCIGRGPAELPTNRQGS
jgi:hypothetical protein